MLGWAHSASLCVIEIMKMLLEFSIITFSNKHENVLDKMNSNLNGFFLFCFIKSPTYGKLCLNFGGHLVMDQWFSTFGSW